MYTRSKNLFPAGTSSLTTSGAQFVGDYASLSVEFGSASTVTIFGSNANGFDTALVAADWSTVSTVAAAGLQKVETGFRWMRAFRSQSTNTVRFHGQVRS